MFGKKKKMAKHNKNVESSMDMTSKSTKSTSNCGTRNCSGTSTKNK